MKSRGEVTVSCPIKWKKEGRRREGNSELNKKERKEGKTERQWKVQKIRMFHQIQIFRYVPQICTWGKVLEYFWFWMSNDVIVWCLLFPSLSSLPTENKRQHGRSVSQVCLHCNACVSLSCAAKLNECGEANTIGPHFCLATLWRNRNSQHSPLRWP